MINSITTSEAEIAIEIFTKIQDPVAKRLYYQCVVHAELFAKASELLKQTKDELDFHNFARSQSCHMTEGVFGAESHAAKMESAKIKTLGYLGVTLSAGHKLLRSLKNARAKDPRPEWKSNKRQLLELEDAYRHARNAYEHLDEAISKGAVSQFKDFSFSIHNVLQFKDTKGKTRTLDFSPETQATVMRLWTSTVNFLESLPRSKPDRYRIIKT